MHGLQPIGTHGHNSRRMVIIDTYVSVVCSVLRMMHAHQGVNPGVL